VASLRKRNSTGCLWRTVGTLTVAGEFAKRFLSQALSRSLARNLFAIFIAPAYDSDVCKALKHLTSPKPAAVDDIPDFVIKSFLISLLLLFLNIL
jgi:hypothetical protein